jgi:hypothetical protein
MNGATSTSSSSSPDDQVGRYADVMQLPGSDLAAWSIDGNANETRRGREAERDAGDGHQGEPQVSEMR